MGINIQMNGKIQLLLKYLKSKTFLNLVKILVGKFANGGLAFISGVIIARCLGADKFGLFTLSRSIHVITLELLGSEAVDNGLVRFASQYLSGDKDKKNLVLNVVLKYKIFAILVVLLPALFFVTPFLESAIGKPVLKDAVIFGLLGGCCASLYRYYLAVMQSHERFTLYAILDSIPNLFKFLAFSILLFAGVLNLFNALVINVLSVFLGAVLGFYLTPKYRTASIGNQKNIAFKLFHFSKWIVVTNLLYTFYSKTDIFLLSYFVSIEELGVYSVALNFMLALDLIYMSVMTGFLPKVSKISTRAAFIDHIRHSGGISLLLAVLVIPLFVFARELIVLTYSIEYLDAVVLFQIQLIGFVFVLLFHPLLLILYARKKTYIMTWVHFILFVLNLIGCLIFIPKYGVAGAAYVVSATKIIGGGLITFFVYKEIKLCGREESLNK